MIVRSSVIGKGLNGHLLRIVQYAASFSDYTVITQDTYPVLAALYAYRPNRLSITIIKIEFAILPYN